MDNIEGNVTRLNYLDKEIILIGTAHVLKQSAELVKKVIDEEKPDSVCIELDAGRYQNIQNPESWANTDVIKVIKSKKVGFLLANLALSSYQKKIAKNLNTTVGQEMLQGIESARETGARLVLADRDIRITFMRLWRKLSFWDKCRLFFGFLFSSGQDKNITKEEVSNLLQEDTLNSVISEMRHQFPVIGEVLISERDQYLAYKIKNAPGSKVVAVLGGAHVPGVKAEIFKSQDIDKITQVPRGSPVFKIIGWAIPVIIIGLFIYGFAISSQTGWEQISSWVLWNGTLAALFTALALGHPLSILTALVTAPFTSLNPLLACGWFAGLVEAVVRKPTVKDIHNVPEDIFSLKKILGNRFLKVLIIVIMANIGSSLGTFIAGADIVKNLF